MKVWIDRGIGLSLTGLGALHTLLTPLFFPAFDSAAVWFAGTGLGLAFLGLLNLARVQTRDPQVRWLCLAANVIGTLLCLAITRVVPEPQAYLALVLAAAALLVSLPFPARVAMVR